MLNGSGQLKMNGLNIGSGDTCKPKNVARQMRAIMRLPNIFKRNKDNNNEFERLNDICNTAFEGAFNKCRLDFGREMVEIMEVKSKLLDVLKSKKAAAPAQELLAKKLLELIAVYFRIIELYVSAKSDNHPVRTHLQAFDEMDEKIEKVYSLIYNLNTQFYLSSDELSGMTAYDEIINEAEALRNVINENYIK